MEPPAPSPGTPPPNERRGVLDFIQGLKSGGTKATPTAPKKPSETTTAQNSSTGALHHHFQEFSWALQQNNFLKISLIVHATVALLIWVGGYLAFTRPVYLQVGSPTLEESAKTFYATDYLKVDPQLIFDQMSYFTITSLSLLHQLDAFSQPPVGLLKGMVRPELILKAQSRYDKNKDTIRKQKFVQNLVINRILAPISNPEKGTVAMFVEGYFSISLADENGDPINRITPYRGKAILRFTPVSQLNPYPFTLEDLEEVIGADKAKEWDEANKKFFKP